MNQVLATWLAVLDHLSYYELFRIPITATDDDVSHAFHAFAAEFHPDAHPTRSAEERAQIAWIFKRGTEAYRVLADPALRAQYDHVLAHGEVRSEKLVVERRSVVPTEGAPWAESVTNPSLRPFVKRAEELFKKGDPKQAKLQLTLAQHLDRDNDALKRFAEELDRAVADKDAEKKSSW